MRKLSADVSDLCDADRRQPVMAYPLFYALPGRLCNIEDFAASPCRFPDTCTWKTIR